MPKQYSDTFPSDMAIEDYRPILDDMDWMHLRSYANPESKPEPGFWSGRKAYWDEQLAKRAAEQNPIEVREAAIQEETQMPYSVERGDEAWGADPFADEELDRQRRRNEMSGALGQGYPSRNTPEDPYLSSPGVAPPQLPPLEMGPPALPPGMGMDDSDSYFQPEITPGVPASDDSEGLERLREILLQREPAPADFGPQARGRFDGRVGQQTPFEVGPDYDLEGPSGPWTPEKYR